MNSIRVCVSLWLTIGLLAVGCDGATDGTARPPASQLAWVAQADVATLRAALDDGSLTSEALVGELLDRIAALDDDPAGPQLNAVLATAPGALDEARARDAELRDGNSRGPLHGIPILLKGNIDIEGLDTTAGSLALVGNTADDDAFLVARLRDAGAVILGSANLSEWANFRSSRSSSGWSSVGRQTKNPHALDRNPCGSSSGSAVAVAAGLTVVSIGTETDGSVVCPAGANGVVGIKPTVGLVSRDGIIPIAHSQDTAGPMGRTVRDAAAVLAAIVARDESDPAEEFPAELPDYLTGLDDDAPRLDGVRIGVWRDHFGAGDDERVEACTAAAIEAFTALGAEVVDPADLGERGGLGAAEGTVLYSEFAPDLAAYLESHGRPNGLATLADVVAYNDTNADRIMPYFGQERMHQALEEGEPLDSKAYRDGLAAAKRISRKAIDGAMKKDRLDAIVGPTNGPAWTTDLVNGDHFGVSTSQLAAVSGYPNVTVPMCDVHGLPIGLSIFGAAFSEPELLRIAHAFELKTQARVTPTMVPTLDLP